MPTTSQTCKPILNLSQFAHKQAKKVVPHRWEMNEKSESIVSSTQDVIDIDLQSNSGMLSETHSFPLIISGTSEDSADFDFLDDEVQCSQNQQSFSKPNQTVASTQSFNVKEIPFSKSQNGNVIDKNKYSVTIKHSSSSLHQRFSCSNPNELYLQAQETTTANLEKNKSNYVNNQILSPVDFPSIINQRDLTMPLKTTPDHYQVLATSRKHWNNSYKPGSEIQELCISKARNSLVQNEIRQQYHSQDSCQPSSIQVSYDNIQPSTESLKKKEVDENNFEMKQSHSPIIPYIVMSQVEKSDHVSIGNYVGNSCKCSGSQTDNIVDTSQMVNPSNQNQDFYSQKYYKSSDYENYGSITAKSQSNSIFTIGAFPNRFNYHSHADHMNNTSNSGFQKFKCSCLENVPLVQTCAKIENNIRSINGKNTNKSENIAMENKYKTCSDKYNTNESRYEAQFNYKDNICDGISSERREISFLSSEPCIKFNSGVSNLEADNPSHFMNNETQRSCRTRFSPTPFYKNQNPLEFHKVPFSNTKTRLKCDGSEFSNNIVNSDELDAPFPSIIGNNNSVCNTQAQASNRLILEKQNCYNWNSLAVSKDQQFEPSIKTLSPALVEETNNHSMSSLTKNNNYLNTLLQLPETNNSSFLKWMDKTRDVNQPSLYKITESKSNEKNTPVFLEEKKPSSYLKNCNESEPGITNGKEIFGNDNIFFTEANKPETINLTNYDTENEDLIFDENVMCSLTETDEELLLADEDDLNKSVINSHLIGRDENENNAQKSNNDNENLAFVPIISDELTFCGQPKKTVSVKPLFLDIEELNSNETRINIPHNIAKG